MSRPLLATALWLVLSLGLTPAFGQTVCPPVTCASTCTTTCGPCVTTCAPTACAPAPCPPACDLIPVTRYFWEAKEVGKWNPFVPNETVYQLVPRTVWESRKRVCPPQSSNQQQPRTYTAPSRLNSYGCCERDASGGDSLAMQPSADPGLASGTSRGAPEPTPALQRPPETIASQPTGGNEQRVVWSSPRPGGTAASLDWSTPLSPPDSAAGQPLRSVPTGQNGYGGVARLDDPVRQVR